MEVVAGYKHTEIGVIPNDWQISVLGDISVISRLAGAEYTSLWVESNNGEIIALRGFNIGKGKLIEKDLVTISNALSLKLKRSRLCSGDVIYPCVGSIGNAVVIEEDNKYHIQQNIARITPDQSVVSSKYLANYLMSFLGEREVARFNASSSQPSVLVGSLRQYRIPLPKLKAEQKLIAEALSDTDALIESLENLIEKKRQIKQGAMQELLTGKKRLQGFSGEWEVKPLGFLLQYEQPTKYLVKSTEYNQNSGIPVLTAGKTFILGYTHEEYGVYQNELPVIIFDDFTTSCQFVDFSFKAKSSAMKILKKQFSDLNIKLLFEILKRMDYPVSDHKRHWIGEFQNLKVKIPNFDEQNAIAKILDDMDSEISNLVLKLSKARQIKQGMMQELLTGRIRLV